MSTAVLAIDGVTAPATRGSNTLTFVPTTELAEGPHGLCASVRDNAGNLAILPSCLTGSSTFRVDTAPPTYPDRQRLHGRTGAARFAHRVRDRQRRQLRLRRGPHRDPQRRRRVPDPRPAVLPGDLRHGRTGRGSARLHRARGGRGRQPEREHAGRARRRRQPGPDPRHHRARGGHGGEGQRHRARQHLGAGDERRVLGGHRRGRRQLGALRGHAQPGRGARGQRAGQGQGRARQRRSRVRPAHDRRRPHAAVRAGRVEDHRGLGRDLRPGPGRGRGVEAEPARRSDQRRDHRRGLRLLRRQRRVRPLDPGGGGTHPVPHRARRRGQPQRSHHRPRHRAADGHHSWPGLPAGWDDAGRRRRGRHALGRGDDADAGGRHVCVRGCASRKRLRPRGAREQPPARTARRHPRHPERPDGRTQLDAGGRGHGHGAREGRREPAPGQRARQPRQPDADLRRLVPRLHRPGRPLHHHRRPRGRPSRFPSCAVPIERTGTATSRPTARK